MARLDEAPLGESSIPGIDRELDPEEVPPQKLDLSVPLDEDERRELGQHLWYEIHQYLQDVSPRAGNVEQWRNDYEMYPTHPNTRWRNASNVTAPLTHIYCQSHHPRLNQQILQADPPMAVVAKSQAAMDAAPHIEEALVSIMEEANYAEHGDDLHHELPEVGNCFLRITYEERYRRAPRFQYDWNPHAFQAFTTAGQPPIDAFFDAVETDNLGRPKVNLGWENVLVHAGPTLKVIPWEDCVILPSTVRDYEDAYGIGERLMIRGIELEQGARIGKYFKDEVEAILSTGGDAVPEDRHERYSHQGVSPTELGGGGVNARKMNLYRDYLCYELCWQMDVDDDGQMEWVVVTLHWDTKRILRCQYLPYEHGQAYYIPFGYFRRPRELWSMGIAEKIASIQAAATAVVNQIMDHADLINAMHGNFFYDGTSGLDPAKYEVDLGIPIAVDNVEGIKLIDITALPAEHYQVYSLLKDMADLVTATSNPSLGKTTDTQKTLGEIQIVAGASSMMFEEAAARVARQHARAWDQIRWLAAQFGENGEVKYRVSAKPGQMITVGGEIDPLTGIPSPIEQMPAASVNGQLVPAPNGYAFGTIPAETLLAEVDLVPAGLKRLSDMQSRLQQATIVQNVALTHPLLMQNLPALAIILDQFFQATGFQQREKVMGEVQKFLTAMGIGNGLMMGLQAGLAAGGNPAANNPAMQGPQGNVAATPDQVPQPPSPDATAQTNPGGPIQ